MANAEKVGVEILLHSHDDLKDAGSFGIVCSLPN